MWLFGHPNVDKLKEKKNINGLIKVLGNKDRDTRKKAVEALGEICDTQTLEPLISILQDKESTIRETVVKTIAKFKDHRIAAPLISVALTDNDPNVKKIAIDLVIKLKPLFVNFTTDSRIATVIPLKKIEEIEEIAKVEERRKKEEAQLQERKRKEEKRKTEEAEKWFNKGIAHKNRKEYEKSIACFDKAIESDPKCAPAWGEKGVALSRTGNLNEAIDCYNKSITYGLDRRYHMVTFWDKGLCEEKVGLIESAFRSFTQVVALKDSTPRDYFFPTIYEEAIRRLQRYKEVIRLLKENQNPG